MASIASTGGDTESPEQREINAIWQKVQAKVVELAGGDPKRLQRMGIDDVLRRLDDFQNPKKPDKFQWFKTAVSRTLQCIQTVGGIVAAGVSTAFAPADMCYNALTFVISAWQGYEGMFENLAELLEKCAEFLDRLSYYDRKMDFRLTRLACQNLQLFVQICDRMIHLRSKHARVFAFTRQLFLNDDGIKDLLGLMDKLNRKESLLVAAQTFEIVHDSAGDIKIILDGQKEQKRKKDAKERRQAVVEALGFHGTEIGATGDPIPTWQRTFDSHKNAIIQGTGEWIAQDDAFVDWATAEAPRKPLIVLAGSNGFGKTSTTVNVLRYLRRQAEGRGPTSRVVTAYFFPDRDSRKSGAEDDKGMLETASKALLWQLTSAFEAMTKAAVQVTERSMGFDGVVDLWKKLFLDNPERQNPNTTFFVVVDGLVPNDMQTFAQLLEGIAPSPSDKSRKVRLLWTAGPQTYAEYQRYAGYSVAASTEVVQIAQRNRGDIQKYIEHRMDLMSILRDPSRPGIAEWRQRILDTLGERCGGDFYKLNSSLTTLAQVDLVEDIEEVLKDAGKERSEQIDAEIRRLNRTRTPKEIAEINEIILWVDTGRQWFTVPTMEALISIRYRHGSHLTTTEAATSVAPSVLAQRLAGHERAASEGGASSDGASPPSVAAAALSISLLPFEQKLVEKYPLFSIADGGYIKWRSPETRDRIPPKAVVLPLASDTSAATAAANASLASQVVHESEVAILRYLLRNNCPPDLYYRINFDEFFDAKISARHKEYVCIDEENAHIKVVIAYLSVLTDEKLKTVRDLARFSREDLLWHMKQVDLSAADKELKMRAGPLLVRLLTGACGIESLFLPPKSTGYVHYMATERGGFVISRVNWVYSTEGVREISRWFADSSVVKAVQEEAALAFVNRVKQASQAQDAALNLHEAVLSHAAKYLARLVYLGHPPLLQLHASCQFLRGYVMRMNPEISRNMKNDASAYFQDDVAEELEQVGNFQADTIRAMEAWAKVALDKKSNSPSQDSIWEYQAFTIVDTESPSPSAKKRAIRRARKAVELDPANFHARLSIASHEGVDDREAIEQLTKLKSDIEAARGSEVSGDNQSALDTEMGELLARTTLWLGNRLWAVGEDDSLAARTHLEGVAYGYAGPEYPGILTYYLDRGLYDHFVNFIDALTKARDIWQDQAQILVIVYLEDILSDATRVSAAADATGRWDVMEAFYMLIAELGEAQECPELVFTAHKHFGLALESSADDKCYLRRIDRLEAAVACLRDHPTIATTLMNFDILIVVNDLAEGYLEEACASDASSEKAESYLGKILGLLSMADVAGGGIVQAATPTSSLITYHRRYGYDSKVVQRWTQRVLLQCIELLSDDDDFNDIEAYMYLYTVLSAMQDYENAAIALLMCKWEAHRKRQEIARLQASGGGDRDTEGGDVDGPGNDETEEEEEEEEEEESSGEDCPESEESAQDDASVDKDAKSVSDARETGAKETTVTREQAQALERSSESSPCGSDSGSVEGRDSDAEESDNGAENSTSDGEDPEALTWGVFCDGCEVVLERRDRPNYQCCDCINAISFDENCYHIVKAGGKLQKRTLCREDHRFISTPAWSPEREAEMTATKGMVPSLEKNFDGQGNLGWAGWMSMDEWKSRLRALYLPE